MEESGLVEVRHSSEEGVQPVLSFVEVVDSLPPKHMGWRVRMGWMAVRKLAAHKGSWVVVELERHGGSELAA